MDILDELIEDYESNDNCIDTNMDNIRKAVMNIAAGHCGDIYRFNQLGSIYMALNEILDARAEMQHILDKIVDLVPDTSNTNNAKEES